MILSATGSKSISGKCISASGEQLVPKIAPHPVKNGASFAESAIDPIALMKTTKMNGWCVKIVL